MPQAAGICSNPGENSITPQLRSYWRTSTTELDEKLKEGAALWWVAVWDGVKATPAASQLICATIRRSALVTTDFHKRFSMSSYSVRPAVAHDAKAIAEIHVATWQAAYKDLMPEDYLDSMTVEKRQAYWREAIEYSEPQVLVATDGDQLVGFVGFDRSRDPKTRSTVGEIWAIYVLPTHWGQGVGLSLWDGARDGLKDEGCTQVTLWVLLGNKRALQFCEQAAGFKREMPSLKTVDFGSVRLEELRLKREID